MRVVGIKTLKDQLSKYVHLAQSGERVLVTDRDRVVAELGPPMEGRSESLEDAALSHAVRQGWLTPPTMKCPLPPRIPVAPLESLLAELEADRDER